MLVVLWFQVQVAYRDIRNSIYTQIYINIKIHYTLTGVRIYMNRQATSGAVLCDCG